MNEDLKIHIRQWLLKADHDLIAAQTIIEYKPIICDVACFHCQQASEKYLKAFLIYRGEKISKTHSVDFLLELCNAIDSDFKSIDFKSMDDFAVEIRYPDNFLSPDLSEAVIYLQIACQVKVIVEKKIVL